MSELLECQEWKIIDASEIVPPKCFRYQKIVPYIFYLYIFLNVAGGIYAIWPWAARWLCCSRW